MRDTIDRIRRGAAASVIAAIALVTLPVGLSERVGAAEPGTRGRWLVLTGKTSTPPPFPAVEVIYGPREAGGVRWRMDVAAPRKEGQPEPPPLLRLEAVTSRDPLEPSREPLRFHRYVLRIDATRETLEYRDARTGEALLPPWKGFEERFVPRPARGCGLERGLPRTAELLGHVLTLVESGGGAEWKPLEGAAVLSLDPGVLVGTGRGFRDAELHRLPQEPERKNYTYLPFTEPEYATMIEAGMDLFTVDGKQWEWVRGKPAFVLRNWDAVPPLSFPADLYRSNYVGDTMFLDEPAILMVGDPNIHKTLRWFPDAAAVLETRIREELIDGAGPAAFHLEREVRKTANLGDLRIEAAIPAWETIYETAFYQVEAGVAGVIHEGRYRTEPFDAALARFAEQGSGPRKHTPRDLLRWHYGFLRGAARAFGKDWGTSIYGQCDPAISPEAVTLAWDMGARYVWFWTSDHDHHMPWPEQLELSRTLKSHAAAHPRPPLRGPAPVLDLAIAIPYGMIASLENLWWVRSMDPEGKNEASKAYQAFMKRVVAEYHRALDAKEDFDFTVDDGRELKGYRRVVRVGE